MSFIGIVTRKEKDTGVTLEAKIVTPNKKKAIKQRFKIKVKKTGLSDYECCVIDQATIRNKIMSQQDLSSIKENINFIYNGENGTRISYLIEDVDSSKLSKFINENGKINSRPKYGENDTTGFIVMNVKKGNESITTKIKITIKQMTEKEVLENIGLKESSLWNAIKGENGYWAKDSSSGHKNIFHNLKFINDSNGLLSSDFELINSVSKTPISVKWDITDKITNDIITQKRINESGIITIPSYKDACTLIGNDGVSIIGSSQYNKRVRIDGLIIKATCTIGESQKIITFNCSTCSKYITNKEVIRYAQEKNNIIIGKEINQVFKYRELSDGVFETINIPESVKEKIYIGLSCGSTSIESISIEPLKLEKGKVDYNYSHRVCKFKKTESYDDSLGVFSSISIDGNSIEDKENFMQNEAISSRWPLTIDVKKLKSSEDSEVKQFTIETTVIASRYTKDGTSESAGGGEETKLYCHIKLNDENVVVSD